MPSIRDTIAAIATGPAPGAIGIVRLSGPDALRVAGTLFRGSRFDAGTAKSHRIYHGVIHDPRTGEALDEALLLLFRRPRSYTGEDVVEFSCHGGPYVLSSVLSATIAAGARHAEPGEFTYRAFLNGRMDLAQAEAVADLIQARSAGAHRAALRQRDGCLSAKIASLRTTLLGAHATLEASLEYDAEDDAPDTHAAATALRSVMADIKALLRTVKLGRVLRSGYRIAIVGRPNVGKSTLLNALAGRDRAIVASTPGTTRDIVEENVSLGGLPVTLMDTAGLRRPRGEVEQVGIERALDATARADAVLVVFDAARRWTQADRRVFEAVSGRCAAIVWNKTDLVPPSLVERLASRYPSPTRSAPVFLVSAVTGTGIPALEEALVQHISRDSDSSDVDVVVHERHAEALDLAKRALLSALDHLEGAEEPVLAADDVREAADALATVVGATTNEDIVREVFRRFCVGK